MGDTRNEPSMDHILASIKRIITDEGNAALGAARAASPLLPEPADPEPAADDVLELTRPVAEPSAGADDEAPVEAAPVIVSRDTASASRQSLAALSAVVVRHEPEQANTLESLVRELLRPMLKDWLDARLPDLVEELVAREIARITGKAL